MRNACLLLLITLSFSSLAIAQTDPTDLTACESFEQARNEYTQSLGTDKSGKPMASTKSVQRAWRLTNVASDCLTEREVKFRRISTYAFEILPADDGEPGKTAALLEEMTGGTVIYDVGFFLRKPYAAGGFEDNILFLPHSAVLGELEMVTRHEINHARAHALWLKDDQRLRHLWIFGKDSMWLDEVLAYADGGVNKANAEDMQTWSLKMAHSYVAETRDMLRNPNAQIATAIDGERCPMSEALKAEVGEMLSCVENVLQSDNPQTTEVAACDGPRPRLDFCSGLGR